MTRPRITSLLRRRSHQSRVACLISISLLAGVVLFRTSPSAAEPSAPDSTAASGTVAFESARDANGHLKRLPDTVTFNAHIRPIMSNTCFACHGPDEEENHSDLRLDSFEAAVNEGRAIKPGAPSDSLIVQRIIDQDDPMPPADFRHQLSEYEKTLFGKWIDQGAEYQTHWSYAPIERPEVPRTNFDDSAAANEIDSFILSRLEFEGLKPSPQAGKATLLRRLSLDLIGLPPTPTELADFLADQSKHAYQKQVERLLASPHFGERMAAQWLDIVRFSDTVGFHGDQNHRIFPYRDYVINALNNNKPFDEFTREQLAGDLLENPTPEQLAATGLVRLNMVTREGGAQPGEYLAKYAADRVRMLGTAWLGSTTGCCECHNHKYDPFSIEDFYALGAFFDDVRQWGVYSNYGFTPNPDLPGFTNNHPFPPEMRLESESLRKQLTHLETTAQNVIGPKLDDGVLHSPEFQSWFQSVASILQGHSDGWVPVDLVKVESKTDTPVEIVGDGEFLATGKPIAGDEITVTANVPNELAFNSIRMQVLPDEANKHQVGRAADGRFQAAVAAGVRHDTSEDALQMLPLRPRYVRIELKGNEPLSLAEVQVFTKPKPDQQANNHGLVNVALSGTASQSSTAYGGQAKRAIDGNTDGEYHRGKSVTHTQRGGESWWELDLGSEQEISAIVIWNRTDPEYQDRLKNYDLILLDDQHNPLWVTNPKTPSPSIKIKVPDECEQDTSLDPLHIEFALADRLRPKSYVNGRPSRFLESVWQSGPDRWQLPKDETKLAHTATYHLRSKVKLNKDEHFQFTIKSSNIGRVRLSVSPLIRYVAGMPATNQPLNDAVKAFANDQPLSPQQRNALKGAWFLASNPLNKLPKDVTSIGEEIAGCRSGMAMTLIAQQASANKRYQSRVLPRGNWQDKSGEKVKPATPHFLPQLPAAEKRELTRLDLADWITSENNPLTARHYVNRLWKHFFGAGLSNQLDDLGNQGEWPSHPQLLDWMASEFRETWDIKHMIRLIVSSSTYQQQAAVRSDLSEIDPYNRLLSQQSARRLEAEIVRDNALAISGLLVTDFVGGPSVFPYQPAGHYSNLQFPNRGYIESSPTLQYRRGIYMHWQRTFLHPMLVNFDAPSRDECAADRVESNSPQQALTLLNDPQFVEASNALAAKLLSENPDASFEDRLQIVFKMAVARKALRLERQSLKTFFDEQLNYYRDNPKEIKQLMYRNGHFRPSADLPQAELAAWAQVCRIVLNLHETITRL